MDLLEMLRARVQREITDNRYKDIKELAVRAGIETASMYNFLNADKKAGLSAQNVERLLRELGARVLWPEDDVSSRKVSLHIFPSTSDQKDKHKIIKSEDNLVALPLIHAQSIVNEDFYNEDLIQDWIAIPKYFEPIKYRISNGKLFIITVHHLQTNMAPTIPAGSLCIIDASDKVIDHDGQIFLVKDSSEPDSIAVKRVQISGNSNEEKIIFYGSDLTKASLKLYDIASTYGGSLNQALIGKCVAAIINIINQ